jgi:outer membrane protein OmpA-like peptidoglycan-associated protein
MMTRALVLVTAVGLLASCAKGEMLQVHAAFTIDETERIHDAAYNCAEREIAMAEAHLDFGLYEMERGYFLDAEDHLDIAVANVEAAARIVDAQPNCWPGFVDDTDGDGYLDDVDDCPYDPEDFDDFEDEDGCPEDDNDSDGYVDWEDDCPNDPEDFDLWEDDDGCPEDDNDGDGYVDWEDDCPNDPEDFDGNEDEDGCPEDEPVYTHVIVTPDRIEITEQIHFAYDSAEILSESFRILNDVGAVLVDNPAMEIRIEGHTDSDGSARYNLQLSDNRAASVRAYLIQMDIDPSRMISVGYGEERPIASNDTDDGKAANRRVEFHIVAQ